MPPNAKLCARAIPPFAAFQAMAHAPNVFQPSAKAPNDQKPALSPPSETNPKAQPPTENKPMAVAPMLTGAIARLPEANNRPMAYSPDAIQAFTGTIGVGRPPLTR